MEAGGADAAARSCWPALDGADNCSNGTLEGLLTPGGQPRSAWWAYRAYAEGGSARVPARSDIRAVAVLASRRTGRGRRRRCCSARHDRAAAGAPPLVGRAHAARPAARARRGAHGDASSIQQLLRTAASSRSPRRRSWPGAGSRSRTRRSRFRWAPGPPPGARRAIVAAVRRAQSPPRRSPRSTRRSATPPARGRPCRRCRPASGGLDPRGRLAGRRAQRRAAARGSPLAAARPRARASLAARIVLVSSIGSRATWRKTSPIVAREHLLEVVLALRVAHVHDHDPAGRQPVARQLEELHGASGRRGCRAGGRCRARSRRSARRSGAGRAARPRGAGAAAGCVMSK